LNPDPLAELSSVEAIRRDHRCDNFDCGKADLNDWLKRYALQSHVSDSARTFVVHQNLDVKGYYSLASQHVLKAEGPERLGSGLPNYPIGVILLARLALDLSVQGIGLGKALLKDAMLRVVNVSSDVGVRAIIVDAIDESARRFYLKHGFASFPQDSMRLMMLLKDVRISMPGTGRGL
jgi:GNAT superfamily N-acetyltransferase